MIRSSNIGDIFPRLSRRGLNSAVTFGRGLFPRWKERILEEDRWELASWDGPVNGKRKKLSYASSARGRHVY